MGMKVKKGDTVLVIAGKDKGAQGQGHPGLPGDAAGSWSRASTGSRSTPRSPTTQRGAKSGGIVTQEAPIHISNVQVVDGDNKPTRVGKRVDSKRAAMFASRAAPVRTL